MRARHPAPLVSPELDAALVVPRGCAGGPPSRSSFISSTIFSLKALKSSSNVLVLLPMMFTEALTSVTAASTLSILLLICTVNSLTSSLFAKFRDIRSIMTPRLLMFNGSSDTVYV